MRGIRFPCSGLVDIDETAKTLEIHMFLKNFFEKSGFLC